MSASRRLLSYVALLATVAGTPLTPLRAAEGGISLPSADVRIVDGVYLLDSDADIELTEPVRSALDSGVALTFAWEVEIGRERGWWWPEAEVAYVTQRYRLEYHALSLQYLVTNLNTGERRSFTRLPTALDFIGRLTGFPIVDRVLLDDPGRHTGYVRLRLEHNTLPLPLRPAALFSAAWYLETDWRTWSFE
ncbi:MAG: DUF4390 domain-containing protein [Halofilum sp. (in: g-proteobacteria)]